MRLAGAGFACKHNVFALLDVSAAGKLEDTLLVEIGHCGELEVREVFLGLPEEAWLQRRGFSEACGFHWL
jgi:hypothetical protein